MRPQELVVLVTVFSGTIGQVQAANRDLAAGTDGERVETVLVTATRGSETSVEDLPLHATLITPADIEQSPAQTLDQLLRNVPAFNFTGVPAALSDPTGQQTKMRGLGNSKVLVLLDGVPVHDPFYMTTQWYKVPLSTIERVEVIRGGNSSLWGSMAVAGVVNIISKRPRDDAGELSASFGSLGTRNVALSKNFVVNDALSFNLAADYYHTDGYQTTPSEHLWRFPDKKPVEALNKNIQLTTFFRPTDDLNGYLRLGYHVQDQDISYRYGNNVQKSPDVAGNVVWDLDESRRFSVSAWAQSVRFEKYNGSTCYYQGGGSCLNSNSAALAPAKVNDDIVQFYTQYGSQRYREKGASFVFDERVNPVLRGIQIGTDFRQLSARDLEFFYTTPSNPADPQGKFNSSTYGKGVQTFAGVFAQTQLRPIDPLEITLSARYDYWRMSDRANTRTTASGVGTGGDLPDTSESAFNPSAALRYALSDQLALRGAAYKAFRAPGFNNLTRTFGTGSSTTIANPDLKPETLTGWEAGADYIRGAVALGLTYFRYDIEDMIATYTATPASAPEQVRLICGGAALVECSGSAKYYTNDQDGRAQGVELTGSWKISDSVSVGGFYTFTETYLTDHGATVTDPLHVQLVGVPKNVASLNLTWTPLARLRVYGEARYIGSMLLDTTSLNNTVRYEQGAITVFNISANYAFTDKLDGFASVVNLSDREYSENAYNYNQPYNRTLSMPRAYTAGFRLRF